MRVNETSMILTCAACLIAVGYGSGASAQVPVAASAPDTGMADFFKGSLTITMPAYPTFEVSRQFSPDHTFVDLDNGQLVRGAWNIENGKICTQRPQGQKYCNLGLGRKVGDGWEDKDPYTGQEVDFDLTADRKPLG